MSKIYVNDCIMIEAGIFQSTVRIWPPTRSFKFSRRHLFSEKAFPTAAPGRSPVRWGAGRCRTPVGTGCPRRASGRSPSFNTEGSAALAPGRGAPVFLRAEDGTWPRVFPRGAALFATSLKGGWVGRLRLRSRKEVWLHLSGPQGRPAAILLMLNSCSEQKLEEDQVAGVWFLNKTERSGFKRKDKAQGKRIAPIFSLTGIHQWPFLIKTLPATANLFCRPKKKKISSEW